MNYLIDTNVISELRRPRQIKRSILEWFAELDPAVSFLSAITIGELEQGIAMAELRGLPHHALLHDWLNDQILPTYAGRIIAVDETIAASFGRLQAPDPKPYADVMIAATALVHSLTVVTRNTRHFDRFNVPLLNPWDLP